MTDHKRVGGAALALKKFQHPDITADGGKRASVALTDFNTLWVNTGTLCNIECAHCYIESSPQNDRLSYISKDEIVPLLNEARMMGAREVGFTGGEPFMNPEMLPLAESALERGFSIIILTNAMRPMQRPKIKSGLLALRRRFPESIRIRTSLDHYAPEAHDMERGAGSFVSALSGLNWLAENNFPISVAGRLRWDQPEKDIRAGFAALFAENGIEIDASDPERLVLFPELDETAPVPEITDKCWGILNKNPRDMMCAQSRMVVKRRGAAAPVITACTLLAYEKQFELGATLKEAARPVKLNHPHCAKFCVLGGASCSG